MVEKTQVLVVEDECNVATVMQVRLESYGYFVCAVATSGPEAIEAATRYAPDVVLMDVRLEGDMDGIEAAQRIRASRPVPVIFLSAYADERLLERAKSTEPFAYILKPYEGKELRMAIEIALYKSRMEQERTLLIEELRKALARVKQLSGLLPICSACKRIRDDEGYWNQIESYLRERAEVEFTHGICPDCMQRLYPEFGSVWGKDLPGSRE